VVAGAGRNPPDLIGVIIWPPIEKQSREGGEQSTESTNAWISVAMGDVSWAPVVSLPGRGQLVRRTGPAHAFRHCPLPSQTKLANCPWLQPQSCREETAVLPVLVI